MASCADRQRKAQIVRARQGNRRSLRLDNLVGGGIAREGNRRQTLAKEAWEETGIRRACLAPVQARASRQPDGRPSVDIRATCGSR
jgi:8-oxo-dGTP pyrophosphatase MutT (NUDIX family)